MRDIVRKKLEITANISIIVLAIAGGSLSIFNALSHPPGGGNTVQGLPAFSSNNVSIDKLVPSPPKGTQISLPGVEWGSYERSFLFVLSTRCHFCSESAPLYRQIASIARERGNIRLIAALPQESAEAAQYLQDLRLSVDKLVQVQPMVIGARGTPTLVLLDRTGVVQDTWFGRLSPVMERELFAIVRTRIRG